MLFPYKLVDVGIYIYYILYYILYIIYIYYIIYILYILYIYCIYYIYIYIIPTTNAFTSTVVGTAAQIVAASAQRGCVPNALHCIHKKD